MIWDQGETAEVTATIKVDGVPSDPSVLWLKVRAPDGTLTTYTYPTSVQVTRQAAGVYVGAITLTAAGIWVYRWESSGVGAGVQEGILQARPSLLDTSGLIVNAEALRAWAPPLFNWSLYGLGVADPDPLDVRASMAVGQLYAITGRTLASITSPEEVAIAQKVLAALVVIEAMGGGEAALQVLEQPWLKSFSAGSYSETRFSPSELGATKSPPYPPGLWALLWALMTEEKRAEWLEMLTGVHRPAGGFVDIDWSDSGVESGPMIFGQGIETWPPG